MALASWNFPDDLMTPSSPGGHEAGAPHQATAIVVDAEGQNAALSDHPTRDMKNLLPELSFASLLHEASRDATGGANRDASPGAGPSSSRRQELALGAGAGPNANRKSIILPEAEHRAPPPPMPFVKSPVDRMVVREPSIAEQHVPVRCGEAADDGVKSRANFWVGLLLGVGLGLVAGFGLGIALMLWIAPREKAAAR